MSLCVRLFAELSHYWKMTKNKKSRKIVPNPKKIRKKPNNNKDQPTVEKLKVCSLGIHALSERLEKL